MVHWLRTQGKVAVIAFAALLVGGIALAPLESRAWADIGEGIPETDLSEMKSGLGQGIMLSVLGGFRAIVADLFFMQTYYYWEQRDREKVESLLALTVSVDPRPYFFWEQGSKMIGYDIRHWRMEEMGGLFSLPDEVVQQISEQQAYRALDFLERGMAYHGDNPDLYVQMGLLMIERIGDKEKAAELFLKAHEMGADYYAGRIYVNLLEEMGKQQAAYEFLKEWYPQLPADDPASLKPIIYAQIRSLEEELNIPLLLRLQAEPPPLLPQHQQYLEAVQGMN